MFQYLHTTFSCIKSHNLHAYMNVLNVKTNLWAADLEEVYGLSTDVHVIGDVSQKNGHTVLHILCDESVALDPEVFVCRNSKTPITCRSTIQPEQFYRSIMPHINSTTHSHTQPALGLKLFLISMTYRAWQNSGCLN